jgi:hypothetical protein
MWYNITPAKKKGRVAMASMTTVTISQVELTLDQLVAAIRQLEPNARSEIARALVETEMDVRMAELIHQLATRPPADDITNADIVAEVNAAREQRRREC